MDGKIKSSISTINKLSSVVKIENVYEELTAAFRHLRNACAAGSLIQEQIVSDEDILSSTQKILNDLIHINNHSSESELCLVVAFQFVANLLVNNHEIQCSVWKTCQELLQHSLTYNNVKIQSCAAMIIYNIFLGHPELISFDQNLHENIISLTTNNETSEFPLYILQLLISNTQFIHEVYDNLKPELKLIIIDVIHDLVKNDGHKCLKVDITDFFVKKFVSYSDNILNILEKLESPYEAHEAVKILDFLASISSCNDSNLQNQNCLIINSVALLKSVHCLSKQPDNNFSMIQKLSELNEIEKNETVQEHPYFGFKSSLIRLIGNLCFKNKENQDKIRELGGIPVLLDCCNIDGRNPFIIQWTILTIRNLCENNWENQKIIAAMPSTHKMDTEKLERMGILLNKESDSGCLSVCPLDLGI